MGPYGPVRPSCVYNTAVCLWVFTCTVLDKTHTVRTVLARYGYGARGWRGAVRTRCAVRARARGGGAAAEGRP
jgi:hypothetical protein